MNYYIVALSEGKQLLGSANSALVYDAKSMVKVNNRLKWFNPDKQHDEIKVFSYTNLYDENTHKLIRTIKTQ